MSYLLDTCVVSELRKSVPNNVRSWFDSIDQELFLKKGHIVGVQDLYIAATAKSHGLSCVTRNMKDFQHTKIPLINPWE